MNDQIAGRTAHPKIQITRSCLRKVAHWARHRSKRVRQLSGPGWLQGAITLGGGSLAGALYLGVIMGYEHDVAATVGHDPGRDHAVSAISYVTLVDRASDRLQTIKQRHQSGARLGLADRHHDGQHRLVPAASLR